jgi:hypothetical protein
MARADAVGLFWEDIAPVKPPKKEKVKRTPPLKYWEALGFIPPGAYEEALGFNFNEMNDMELIAAQAAGHRLIYDVESYPNYGLHGFKNIVTGKYLFFESSDFGHDFDRRKLKWVLTKFTLITFNGLKYDETIAQISVDEKYDHTDMWAATDLLIGQQCKPYEVLRHYGISFKKGNKLSIDQIDIKELTALSPGLKKCAARLHAPKLQDLPFKPGTDLTLEQCVVLKRYNVNDLDNTQIVYISKLDVIELREEVGKKYKVDLRSKSDAQMAEAIIKAEYIRRTGDKFIKPVEIAHGTMYRFKTPSFVHFQTPYLNSVLKAIQDAAYIVGTYEGGILNPPELANMKLTIGNLTYQVGIGGLHSQESNISYVADDEYFIADTDATSYYPTLILNAGLTPVNMGNIFLSIYRGVYEQRLAAKASGDGITAQCLKIVLNGTFGKLASMFSIMYSPNLMMQVTLTGQLSLLMLIERFELAGIQVINANTDGVVVRCKRSMRATFDAIVAQWGKETGFGTEETRYKMYSAKDVNNYIAAYEKPEKGNWFKTKGLYAKTSSQKNAVNEVCITALKEYLEKGTSIAHTIRSCKEISMFTSMRELAKGGGGVFMKSEQEYKFLGKTVRWYYSTNASGQIVMANSGNKVPRSDGAQPCMDLPLGIPEDLDYEWYINEAYSILEKVGQGDLTHA